MIGVGFRVELSKGFGRLVETKIPMAIARGLNEGGDKVRTQVQKALWRQTGLSKYRSVTSRISTMRAFPGANAGLGPNANNHGSLYTARSVGATMAYVIVAHGKGIPIIEFPVSSTGHGIDARSWGIDHLFRRSFQIAGRGPEGFRARLGAKRFPIRRLYGPALPKELGKGAIPDVFMSSAQEFVPPAVIKHLAKALS